MTLLRLTFDDGEDAFDTSAIVAYETTKRRVDAAGNDNPQGRTHLRDARVHLSSGATILTTFYADDWLRFLEAIDDRGD